MTYQPFYWLNQESRDFLAKGYLLPGQSPEDRIRFIANRAEQHLGISGYADKFYDYMSRGWFSLSSPVWSNYGLERGMPVSCITGDTWVNTSTGGKQAKDISIGDLVLTHKNRFRPITAVIPTENRSNIWKLKVGTRMTNLYITENHPVLTNLGWVRVDELDPNKHLIAVNGKVEYTPINHTIDMKLYAPSDYIVDNGCIVKPINENNKTQFTSIPVKEFVKVSIDLAWALGLWFAEGSLTSRDNGSPSGIRITLNAVDEEDLATKWATIIAREFNVNCSISTTELIRNNKPNAWLNVNTSSALLGNLFASFGKGCKHKQLPEWLLSLPEEHLAAFLEGILAGDGTKRSDDSVKLTLANPKLILQVYNIGLKLDKSMSLQMQEKAGKLATTTHVYTLVFRNYTMSKKRHSSNAGIPFNDGLTYCPIITLELTNKVETVYDFTVEEDHSFSCAGVIVHNCFGGYVPDSTEGILYTHAEQGMLSKLGGGTSLYFGDVRPRGAPITNNGESNGVVPFIRMMDTMTDVISQGSTRRGYMAVYLPIDHADIHEFLEIGSDGNEIQGIMTGVNVSDAWLKSMTAGDSDKRALWAKVLRKRSEHGYPYIFFTDNVNNHKPECYRDNPILASNLCVTGDTKILTREGYKPIASLVGTTVDCWNGTNWSPTPIFQTSEGQEVLEVSLSNGHIIRATPYHKWYVAKQDSRGRLIGEEMKRTFELQPNDKLIKYNLEPVTHGSKVLPHAYDNGFHTADGTVYPNNAARISLYGDKAKLLDKFSGHRNLTVDSNHRLNLNYAAGVLQDKFFVPSSDYTVESRLTWLAGLFDGDGTLTNNNGTESIQLVSINKPFLLELQLLLQELGVDSKISLASEAAYRKLPANDGTGELKDFWCKESYRILIAGSYLNHLVALGLPTARVVPTVREYNRKATQFVRVISVTDNNEVAPTYCGTEPEHNKLMFNGVLTGNCSEIALPSSESETFTCVLSSLNLLHYDEWKDTDAVEVLTMFLDTVVQELINSIDSGKYSKFMERVRNFAVNHRALI